MLTSTQRASPKLQTHHLLLLPRTLEDRKILSEGTKWIFIVRKINVETAVRRPIKWPLIPIDINQSQMVRQLFV